MANRSAGFNELNRKEEDEMHGIKAGMMVGVLGGLAPSAVAADRLVVGLMGDSTVAEDKPDDATRGWGQCLGEFLDDVEIFNKAVGGLSTKTCLLNGNIDMLLTRKPSYVLIQFGHNDSHAKGNPESTDAATDYKENLRKIVDMTRTAGAIPVLVTPMHRRVFEGDGNVSQELKPYAEAMKEVAKEKGVFLVDLYTPSGTLFDRLGDAGSADLSCKVDDRTHFSEAGAREMARLVAEGLNGENGALAKRLKTGK